MKKFARMLSVVFFIVIFLGSVSGSQFVFSAAETSGKTGDCTWKLNGTVLTISGEGKIQDFPHVGNMYGGAPWGKDITSVIIKDGVTEIGNAAFYNCKNLTQVSMPDSLTRIGMVSFYGCEKLSVISIPDSIVRIEDGAFSNTAWLSNKPDGLVYAGKVAYIYKGNKKNITSVSIKDGTKYITGSAFFGCSGLKTISVPDSVESIGNNAFNGTAWYDNKSNGIIYAGKVAYGYKGSMPSGKIIELRKDTKGIAGYAFWNCTNLKSVFIPDRVRHIEDYAFFGCTSLEDIYIGKGVVFIGEKAFTKTNLRDIVIPANTTHIGQNALGYSSSGGMLPAAAVDGFVIYGTKGTEAESYALSNNFTFELDNRLLWGEDVLDVSGNPTGLGWGRDNFAFTNNGKYFDKTYTISEKYFNALTVGLDDTIVRELRNNASSSWGGSCYGMANAASLMKTGFLTPSLYTEGAETAHDLSAPNKEPKVMDIINFYYLAQYLQDIKDNITNKDNEPISLENLVNEAKEVKKEGMPVVVCFNWEAKNKNESFFSLTLGQKKKLLKGSDDNNDVWINDQGEHYTFTDEVIDTLENNGLFKDTIEVDVGAGKNTYIISYKDNGNTIELVKDGISTSYYRCKNSGHAVVAYDAHTFSENSDNNLAENGKHYKHRISIYDPNKTQSTYLWVSENYDDWYYHYMSLNAATNTSEVTHDTNGNDNKILSLVISDERLLNIRNPEKGIDNVSDDYKHNVDYFTVENYGIFKVNVNNEKKYTVNNYDISEASELKRRYIYGATEEGTESSLKTLYYLPDSAPKNKPMKISTQKSSDRLDIDVMYENYSFEIESDYARNVDVDPQNASVSLSSKSGDFKLGATFNSGCSLARPTVTVKGRDSARTSMRFVSDGTIIEGDNLNNIIISSISPEDEVSMTFSTDKGAVKMMDIDNDTIGVFVDSDNNGTYETLLKTSDDITARILGDVDDDGKVEVTDATWIQRHIANAEMPFIPLKLTSDIDFDGEITSIDATMIQYFTVYKKTLYKIGEPIA